MDIEINKINAFIMQNMKQDFSLTDIASYLNYSVYHLSREYKKMTGRSIMEFVRECKIMESAKEIALGRAVFETALEYGFDTHSGFTRAFSEIIGCSPQEYYQHKNKIKGDIYMDNSKLKIRLVCQDDVNDLWENVYSAMTPRQIMENKILSSLESYKNQKGFHAVAELDGKIIMTIIVERIYYGPGFVYDSHYIWQNNEQDYIFTKLLEGVKKFAKQLHMPVLCLYEEKNSPFIEGFINCGFEKVFTVDGIEYYMLAI